MAIRLHCPDLDLNVSAGASFALPEGPARHLGLVLRAKVGSEAQLFDVALGVVLSFVSALVCIKLFLKAIDSIGMLPFVIYRLLLGMMLFGMLLLL